MIYVLHKYVHWKLKYSTQHFWDSTTLLLIKTQNLPNHIFLILYHLKYKYLLQTEDWLPHFLKHYIWWIISDKSTDIDLTCLLTRSKFRLYNATHQMKNWSIYLTHRLLTFKTRLKCHLRTLQAHKLKIYHSRKANPRLPPNSKWNYIAPLDSDRIIGKDSSAIGKFFCFNAGTYTCSVHTHAEWCVVEKVRVCWEMIMRKEQRGVFLILRRISFHFSDKRVGARD